MSFKVRKPSSVLVLNLVLDIVPLWKATYNHTMSYADVSFERVYETLSFEKLKYQDDPSLKAQTLRQIAAQQCCAANSAIV